MDTLLAMIVDQTEVVVPNKADGAVLLLQSKVLALKHESRILGQWSNPVCDFSMMEPVQLCDVWPTENWLGSSLNQTDTGLDHCPRILLSCFEARTSDYKARADNLSLIARVDC